MLPLSALAPERPTDTALFPAPTPTETASAVPSVSSTRTAVVAASACVYTVTTSLPLPGRIASEPVGRVSVIVPKPASVAVFLPVTVAWPAFAGSAATTISSSESVPTIRTFWAEAMPAYVTTATPPSVATPALLAAPSTSVWGAVCRATSITT